MKNTFGNALTVTLFGESHGECIGAVLDGLAPGIEIDHEYIKARLSARRPQGKISTSRVEADEYNIVSGVYRGYTTGTPLTLIIPNTNKKSGDYDGIALTPRPSHADYAAYCKYHGYEDGRGGGHFSGRITAALVAVGAILASALEKRGVLIGTHISSLGGIRDEAFSDYPSDIKALSIRRFPTLSREAEEKMTGRIEEVGADGDSIGGVLETAIVGVPEGVGEPWFDTVEGMLAHALFSVPAVKGVEFGAGFGIADMLGSEANDPIAIRDGRVVTLTNNNGGINGGITNGMPILFRCAIKPTPSIFKEQASVDISKMQETNIRLEGRHDPCIVHRARAVIDAVAAIVVADMLTVRYGTDYLGEKKN